ncbi:MAG: 4a-hydroxytetrahydrobiopterin dehydratase, partial [Verrucomicrobiales bacterium]|nr:4a-hydroxytetrahydrobiopterin dehydratase [Verrucomicrobiales bacterium]
MPHLISHEEVQEKMKKIPEWEFNETSISKIFEFDEYLSAIEFVNSVAEIA